MTGAFFTIVSLLWLLNYAEAFPSTFNGRKRAFKAPRQTVELWVASIDKVNAEASTPANEDKIIRPIHQNWFPVALESSLDKARPNGLEVLGKKLVLFHNGSDWTCLNDMCQHRFAPLSEGRIVQGGCLQCAYHGWEYNSEGACTKIPQQTEEANVKKIASYPVRREVGIIWVWTDPSSTKMAESIALPVSSLLKRFVEEFGESTAFMRDLPYGMEILGENLLDLSHLPFSHHSVGSLSRSLGRPLPLRMLSDQEKKEKAAFEESPDAVVPFYQGEVKDASKHDPVLMMVGMTMPVPENSTAKIAYYDACHVRYRRDRGRPGTASHVELFMCPVSSSKSRVFLFNVVESILPPDQATEQESGGKTGFSFKGLKEKFKQAAIKRVFATNRVKGHMLSHQIFDGDGIFLNIQGDRMKREGLSFRDYTTPNSADLLVNAFRRYLEKAVAKSRDAGYSIEASAFDPSGYDDSIPRSSMLDRYASHTKHCTVCSTALKKCEQRKKMLERLEVGLIGAAGASIATALVGVISNTLPAKASRSFATAALVASLGAIASVRSQKSTQLEIDQFHFVDYVHAEKD